MSIGGALSGVPLRIGFSVHQIQRDDEEQQLLDAYVKNSAVAKPISTRKLTQQRLREAAFADQEQHNSLAACAAPPSLASLALHVFARNFTKLLRVTQAEDSEAAGATGTQNATAASSASLAAAGTAAPAVESQNSATAAQRKSRRVAAATRSQDSSAITSAAADGKPSPEQSRRTHERLRLLPSQHLCALQELLQKHHRRALTVLTLRRYFLPPTNTRLHISPAIPLVTENPDLGPARLLSAATAHAKNTTHASLIALNRLDAKFFHKFTMQATSLEYLDLSASVNVNAGVLRALAKACKDEGKPSRLRYLNLDATAVGATGLAIAIAEFRQLEVLKTANVQGLDDPILAEAILTAITAEAESNANDVSELRALGRLRSLKLRRTMIGNNSLGLILDMCDPKLLHTLDIGFTQCSLEGLLDAIKAPTPAQLPPVGPYAQELGNMPSDQTYSAGSFERSRNGSPSHMVDTDGTAGTATSSLITPPDAGSPTATTLLPALHSSQAGPSNSQTATAPLPEYASKFSFRKLSLSGLYLHSFRSTPENRLQPLRTLLKTQTELQSLYLQRIPHFSREYDLVQELVAVLREGLQHILDLNAGRSALEAGRGPATDFLGTSETPLFKRLVLSDNPALGMRVKEARQRGGWYYAYQIHEQEEAAAGELGKLMRAVGIYCEEVRLSNVALLPSHLAFSRFQRVLELDHTGIEDATILDALERAAMIPSTDAVETSAAESSAQPSGEQQIGRTRSGRAAPGAKTGHSRSKGKNKAIAAEDVKSQLVVGNLRRISLVDAKVSDESLRPLLEANPFLQEIDLTSCRSIAVTQRRNYFEHIFGVEDDDESVGDDDTIDSSTDSLATRKRPSKTNPYRSTSDRRAVVARRQAASGTTLTRQEMIDDDFVINSDSDYDEYGASRSKRRRSNSSSPRKRSASSSPAKRKASTSRAVQQRSEEEVRQAVKSAKTARLAAAARLQGSGYYSTSSSNRRQSGPSAGASGSSKRRDLEAADSDEDESTEATASEEPTTDDDDDDDSDPDELPLSQRKPKRRRLTTDGPGAPLARRRRPKRSAARNLSLVDQLHFADNEEEDPDFSVSRTRSSGRSPSKSDRSSAAGPSTAPSTSSGARHLRRSSSGASAFVSSSRTPDGADSSSTLNRASSARRRSASPTRSPSTRVRDLAVRASEAARESRARAREQAAEEEQAARAARAARRAKDDA
ncbi:hypothetical protein OC835_006997 [Tilletia horrida]|nr:hypothetical protein OC835_006997 [Tilletia horrida]